MDGITMWPKRRFEGVIKTNVKHRLERVDVHKRVSNRVSWRAVGFHATRKLC
jgi:hypothetical protein